jgi:hypothetical protein
MAGKTTEKPAAAAKKAAAKRVAAKAKKPAKPATRKPAKTARPPARKPAKPARNPLPKPKPGEVVLLSGGNPQIAKGYGDAPVQAYIAAMPDWKKDVGRRLDAIIGQIVPGVKKAVKWNTPLYGAEEGSWFLGFHVFAKYIKVTFFRGTSLAPVPPGMSKHKEVRYYDIREGALDEAQFTDWVKQASRLPGERM